jgi:hemerythrin-like domain-containing protein
MVEQYPQLLVEINDRHDGVREKLVLLDHVLREVELQAAAEQNQMTLRELAAFFNGELLRLIELEEAIFPPIDTAIHEIGGPVAALRLEHDELKRLAEVFGATVAAFERNEAATIHTLKWCAERLQNLLLVHLEKEETVLFQMAQKVLTSDDWTKAAERARLGEKEKPC